MDASLDQFERATLHRAPMVTKTLQHEEPLVSIGYLRTVVSTSPSVEKQVQRTIGHIQDFFKSRQHRLLVIVGPCSVHHEKDTLYYAERLTALRQRYAQRLEIIMRAYFEKPRTALGWQGFLSDPYRDGSYDINTGLKRSRSLLLEINKLGLPTATEFLDPLIAPYFSDLISWGAIGARSTENQLQRNLASGLPMPIGFKNGTNGQIDIAIAAIVAAQASHSLLWSDHQGQLCRYITSGNPWGHLVLRGGKHASNDHPEKVNRAIQQLRASNLLHKVIIDCSHGNKRFGANGQFQTCLELCQRLRTKEFTTDAILGVMLESFLRGGNQVPSSKRLQFGQSITDHCLSWKETEECIDRLAHSI